MARYRGRHRAPSTTGRTIARTALAGAVAGVPLLTATPAADAAPDATWDRVAQCESSGDWSINTGNGFYGGLQFTASTWRAFGGGQFADMAHRATREEQIVVAERVLAGQGWKAWPVCSRKTGATGQPATQRIAPDVRPAAPAAPAPAAPAPAAAAPAAPAPAAPAPAAPAPTEPAAATSATVGGYVVQPGDTLSDIATARNIAGGWQAIVVNNPGLTSPNLIHPGQRLTL
jgi:resuscitation-promoting factor RpfA